MSEFRVLVFISGRGSNLRSLSEEAKEYSICGVISNVPDAIGGKYAIESGIPYYPFNRSDYKSLTALKNAIFQKTKDIAPDLIVLAGYMQIIQPEFVDYYNGKMINIHPALLPKYPGLNTHARAIAAHDKIHGCTVHYVSNELDAGSLIAQASCELSEEDTEISAAEKVLALEHKLYPWVVRNIALNNISLLNDKVMYTEELRRLARERNFKIFI